MRNKLMVISLILLLLLTSTVILASDNVISIPHKMKVKGMEIELNQIASISGNDNFKSRVGDISLGQAPLPGYQRVIYRDEVIYALKNLKLDLSNISLQIPYQFTVLADYKEVPINKLIDLGKNYIHDSLPYQKNEIEIDVTNPPKELVVPYGKLRLDVGDFYQRNLIGSTTIPIEVIVNDNVYRRVYIQYKVGVLQEVLVAKERIQKGQLIDLDLFDIEKRSITSSNNQFFDASTDLSGKRMKISLSSGRPLLKSMVEFPPLVERWKEVTIIARIGGIEVTTVGKSLQSGQMGEIIKVQNINSRKTIKAKVIDKGMVEVLID